MTQSAEVQIYTDGACKVNPGPGGWAWVELNARGEEVQSRSGGKEHTTNNQMELQGVIEALTTYPAAQPVHIVTDSTYVAKGIKEWLAGWKRRGWQKSTGGTVRNVELWQQLDSLLGGRQVRVSWVKGHATSIGNELADRYASSAATNIQRQAKG